MLTQTLPLSTAATYINDQVQHIPDFLSPLQNETETHPTVKAANYVRDLRDAFTNLEFESRDLVDGVTSVASSGRISPVAQKMKQLIDAKSEYENSGEALLSWTAILRLRDLLQETITNSLTQPDSGNHPGANWRTFAKSQFQACIALAEEELMRILPATMNEVETGRVKHIFNAVLQFELALLDSAYARAQPDVNLTQQSSSPWHPSNIIFTTDFDVTCTIVDSCYSLVRAAESAAKKSSGDFRPGKLLEVYDAALDRHAIRSKITLNSLENPEKSIEVTKRLSGRDETSEDVVPGMDPSLKPLFDSIIKATAVPSSEDSEKVSFEEAGLRRALSKLSDMEVLCNKDIMSSGVLSGFTRDGVLTEAKLVELRPHCAAALKQLVEIGTQINVVSANWSRDLIVGGLPSLPEGKLFVHCNEMLYDSFGVSTGIIDNTVVDAFDKEQMLRALRTLYSHYDGKNANLQVGATAQAERKTGRMMIYMGDSHTDLLGLLEADLGIVIGASSAARKVMSLYGIKLVPLLEASECISRARFDGSQCSWRRSGILFEAQGWEDVQACLSLVASPPITTNPVEPSEQSSADPVVQQQRLFDATDMSQERLPPAKAELVQVAC
ncbi:unnamed protein product [Calypogeia fissa]